MTVWSLPESIADVLPAEAARVEALRRRLLDEYRLHGYELVIPPLLEYVESLLTGTGRDMDLQTFKLVDQLSGRTMGIRADITPQVARIDAHLLNRAGVTRMCYAGSVLHTLPEGLSATREPMQVGAELYGHAGLEADLEIQELVLRSLDILGAKNPHLDVSHAGIFTALADRSELNGVARAEFFALLQAKDVPALKARTAALDKALQASWLALPTLYGDHTVLAAARRALPDDPRIAAGLDDLDVMQRHAAGVQMSFDLADLRGYHYHSGLMFAAYVDGVPNAIVRGGRYDQVGRAFGRARPATGFTLDLREAVRLQADGPACVGILAPCLAASDAAQTASLSALVAALRASGEIVVRALPGHDVLEWEPCCNRQIVSQSGQWVVQTLPHTHKK